MSERTRNPSMTEGDEARFWSKIECRGDDECWPWDGTLAEGYGYFKVSGQSRRASRVVYELLVGPIPDGLVIDHICHQPRACDGGEGCPHRRCCNPSHLVVATNAENISAGRLSHVNRRKTHCSNGHEFTPENTYWCKSGWRRCRLCRKDQARARRAPRKDRGA